jgi:hypothetical protein
MVRSTPQGAAERTAKLARQAEALAPRNYDAFREIEA